MIVQAKAVPACPTLLLLLYSPTALQSVGTLRPPPPSPPSGDRAETRASPPEIDRASPP